MTKQEKVFEFQTTLAVVLLAIGTIFILGMITGKSMKHQTKYEYYTKDGEKGTTYKCESSEEKGARCEINGNMIEVSQFSEVEK